jgi:phosphatidylserine decarboxylase
MSFPGSQAVTLREFQDANRRLARASKRARSARKAAAVAETELKEARAHLRRLLDLTKRQADAAARPVCPECSQPLGSGAACLECSALRAAAQ